MKNSLENLTNQVAYLIGYTPNSLPEEWKQFLYNMHKNTGSGVEGVVLFILNTFKGKWKKYFSPVQGFNLCNNQSNQYMEDQYIGYFGLGTFRGELLTSDYVKKILSNQRAKDYHIKTDFLRLSYSNEGWDVQLNPGDNIEETRKLLYYCRYMQYGPPMKYYKDLEDYISYDAPYFNTILQGILSGINYQDHLNIDEIGVVEFVIPDFDATTKDKQIRMDARKLIKNISHIILQGIESINCIHE